jgi:hypothetical protein
MKMTEDEWVDLGAWLAACFPGHTIGDATWEAWYEELRGFSQDEVRDALRRCIREVPRLPTVANIYKAIDANHADARKERERYESGIQQRTLAGKRGVPPPPEFKKALRVFGDATSWQDGKMRPEARKEIEELARKIQERPPRELPLDGESGLRDPSGVWS